MRSMLGWGTYALGVLGSLWLAQPAAALQGVCTMDLAADRTLVSAEWTATDLSVAELSLSTPAHAVTMTVDVRVTLGPLVLHWVEGPYGVTGAASNPWSVTIPEEAFMHPAAADYVADLLIIANFQDADGRELQEVAAPAAYVAWPDGQAGGPVVWDATDLAAYAPDGRLSAHTTDPAYSNLILRYVAPIASEVNPQRQVLQDEGRERVTVPADDNSDEEVEP